MLVILIKFGFH